MRPGRSYRAAFDAAARMSLTDASLVAGRWARWAVSVGDVAEAAEAYWRLVRQGPAEVARRQHWEDGAELVAAGQGTAAEACHWLVLAGREQEAVVAVELSRALLLRQRVGRVPPDLADRLRRAGRPDLYQRYLRAAGDWDRARSGEHLTGPAAAPPVRVGGVSYSVGVSSTQYAWSEYTRVAREVTGALGTAGPVRPPDWETVLAAAVDAPVVYLVAAEAAGHALVVDRGGLRVFRLAGLTRAEAARRVGAAPGPELLGWLWRAAVSVVAGALPAGSTVTLVPVGALGLLPWHAARDGDADALDLLRVRYAPSAQALVAARSAAAAVRSGSVLVVDGGADPPHAAVEAESVRRWYGGERFPMTHDEVVRRLAGAAVWHVACHGSADAADPLGSALHLPDRDLTLREILALPPGAHRLAVLSACETGVPDPDRLDEVISFPGALLYAGVAGVVATAWPVDDEAAMHLTLNFHARWRDGEPPATALALAQRWLRDATGLGVRPAGVPESVWRRHRPFADPRHWAAFSLTGC